MKAWSITILVALALAFWSTPAIEAETVQARIGNQARVWGYVPNRAACTRVVAMWQKKGTDLDILIFGDRPPPDGMLVGVGLGTEKQLELVEIGAPGPAATYILIGKVSGPPTKVWFNVSTMGYETVSAGEGPQMVYLGTLDKLAAKEPFFAKMRETQERVFQMKRQGR